MNAKAEIYHLYHSGTAVKMEDTLLIFDFYKDKLTADITDIFPGFENIKEVYVFASHGHADHFSSDIFSWRDYNSGIKYILSSDIRHKSQQSEVNFMSPGQKLKLGALQVNAFGSTDLGVSFLVQVKGNTIFHSGDLNWWHWQSFSETELKKEEKDFKKEVDKLKGRQIDIAFVPVDPRLEDYYYLAGEYFAQTIGPRILVPIHFGEKYSVVEKFQKKIADSSVKVPGINRKERLIYTFNSGDENE